MNHDDVPDFLRAPVVPPALSGIPGTLAKRHATYGLFENQASVTQGLLRVFSAGRCWGDMTDSQHEALHMIASKLARIINGDPGYVDSWHDIAGYATLIENQLTRGDLTK